MLNLPNIGTSLSWGFRRTCRIGVVFFILSVVSCNRGSEIEGNVSVKPKSIQATPIDPNTRSILLDAAATGEKTVRIILFPMKRSFEKTIEAIEKGHGSVIWSDLRLGCLQVAIAPEIALEIFEQVELLEIAIDHSFVVEKDRAKTTMSSGTRGFEDPLGFTTFWKNMKTRGSGVKIAVLDSGVDVGHPFFARQGMVKIAQVRDFSGEGDIVLRSVDSLGSGRVSCDGNSLLLPDDFLGEEVSCGWFDEKTIKDSPVFELNQNGTFEERIHILAYKQSGRRVVMVDRDNDLSFRNETPVGDFQEKHEFLSLGLEHPLHLGVNIFSNDGQPLTAVGADGAVQPKIELHFDGNGHGTHVAGIILGEPDRENGLFGGSPDAELHVLKIEGASGAISLGAVVKALAYVIEQGIEVVNMSFNLKSGQGQTPLDRIVDRVSRDFGIVFSVAAGNHGPFSSTISSPGLAEEAITTGGYITMSMQKTQGWAEYPLDDVLWIDSNTGPLLGGLAKPDLIASGAVLSSVPSWYQPWETPTISGFEVRVGTSMATPQTTAAAALLLAAAKMNGVSLDKDEIKSLLQESGRGLSGYRHFEQGAGIVDLRNAAGLFEQFSEMKGKLTFFQGQAKVEALSIEAGRSERATLAIAATRQIMLKATSDVDWLVTAKTLTVGKDKRKDFEITIAIADLPSGQLHEGSIGFFDEGSGRRIAVLPVRVLKPLRFSSRTTRELKLAGTVGPGRTDRFFVKVDEDEPVFSLSLAASSKNSRLKLHGRCGENTFISRDLELDKPFHGSIDNKNGCLHEFVIRGDEQQANSSYILLLTGLSVSMVESEVSYSSQGVSGRITLAARGVIPTLKNEIDFIGIKKSHLLLFQPHQHHRFGVDLLGDSDRLQIELESVNQELDLDLSLIDPARHLLSSTHATGTTDTLRLQLSDSTPKRLVLHAARLDSDHRRKNEPVRIIETQKIPLKTKMIYGDDDYTRADGDRWTEEFVIETGVIPVLPENAKMVFRFMIKSLKGRSLLEIPIELDPKRLAKKQDYLEDRDPASAEDISTDSPAIPSDQDPNLLSIQSDESSDRFNPGQ